MPTKEPPEDVESLESTKEPLEVMESSGHDKEPLEVVQSQETEKKISSLRWNDLSKEIKTKDEFSLESEPVDKVVS